MTAGVGCGASSRRRVWCVVSASLDGLSCYSLARSAAERSVELVALKECRSRSDINERYMRPRESRSRSSRSTTRLSAATAPTAVPTAPTASGRRVDGPDRSCASVKQVEVHLVQTSPAARPSEASAVARAGRDGIARDSDRNGGAVPVPSGPGWGGAPFSPISMRTWTEGAAGGMHGAPVRQKSIHPPSRWGHPPH